MPRIPTVQKGRSPHRLALLVRAVHHHGGVGVVVVWDRDPWAQRYKQDLSSLGAPNPGRVGAANSASTRKDGNLPKAELGGDRGWSGGYQAWCTEAWCQDLVPIPGGCWLLQTRPVGEGEVELPCGQLGGYQGAEASFPGGLKNNQIGEYGKRGKLH